MEDPCRNAESAPEFRRHPAAQYSVMQPTVDRKTRLEAVSAHDGETASCQQTTSIRSGCSVAAGVTH